MPDSPLFQIFAVIQYAIILFFIVLGMYIFVSLVKLIQKANVALDIYINKNKF